MNKNFNYTERQRQWLEFMKTTDLPQSKGTLRDDEGYCCLGLACKIFDWGFAGLSDDGEGLTEEQAEALQLRDVLGVAKHDFIVDGKHYPSLTLANDNYVPFKKLAEIIEADPENFFTNNDSAEE